MTNPQDQDFSTSLFHNFDTESFTGYWNGKPHTFKAGEKKYMPSYLAEHFAKHLTNRILTRNGKELYCSPKKPQEVPAFWEIFTKACIKQEESSGDDQADMEIREKNMTSDLRPPVNPRRMQTVVEKDPFDANAEKQTGPAGESTVIGENADDEAEYDTDSNKG